jgi:hypothetical protein
MSRQEAATRHGSSVTRSLSVSSRRARPSPHADGVASERRKTCTVCSAPTRRPSASHNCQTRLVVLLVSSVSICLFHVGCGTAQADASLGRTYLSPSPHFLLMKNWSYRYSTSRVGHRNCHWHRIVHTFFERWRGLFVLLPLWLRASR